MKFTYDLRTVNDKFVKKFPNDVSRLLACKALVKTDEGYALKITGNSNSINNNHARKLGERFCIRYRRKRKLAGIDWDTMTREFFVFVYFDGELFNRYCSIGTHEQLSKILEELMEPLQGMWNANYSEDILTVTKRTKSKNLLGRLIGADDTTEEEINFQDFIKVLDARVDCVVNLLGGKRKVDIDWG